VRSGAHDKDRRKLRCTGLGLLALFWSEGELLGRRRVCRLPYRFTISTALLYFFFLRYFVPIPGVGLPSLLRFMITLRHNTFGRTPLVEWSARRRDLYLTTHYTHKRQKSMLPGDSNSQSQQASGSWPTSWTARQLDSCCCKWEWNVKFGFNFVLYLRRKVNWIGHILRRHCLRNRVTEGRIKGRIKVVGRQWKRRKQLLHNL